MGQVLERTGQVSRLPLSIFVITKNEARRLGASLAAVADLADEIVVVDSGSTDGTPDIARSLGARVIETSWRGYGPQKRFAEDQCRNNWVLNIDADEVVTDALRAEIVALFAQGEPPLDGYSFPILEVLPKWASPGVLPHVVSPVRLYRLDRGRYADALVHDRVHFAAGARTGELASHAKHFSMISISQTVRKLNEYSDLQVEDMRQRNRTVATARVWVEFPLAFFKYYLVRRHFLRGSAGLVAATNYAFYRFLRVAKALEARDP